MTENLEKESYVHLFDRFLPGGDYPVLWKCVDFESPTHAQTGDTRFVSLARLRTIVDLSVDLSPDRASVQGTSIERGTPRGTPIERGTPRGTPIQQGTPTKILPPPSPDRNASGSAAREQVMSPLKIKN